MRRRLLLILTALVAVALAVVVTLPWWFGMAARRVGGSYGLSFSRYERLGYARFVLHDVEYRRGNVRVTMSRVESETPLLWQWERWRGRPPAISGGKWAVTVAPNPNPSVASAPSSVDGWVPLRGILFRVAAELDRWLPVATVGPGMVSWPAGKVELASATWSQRTLKVENLIYGPLQTSLTTLAFPIGTDMMRLTARTADGLGATALENTGAAVKGSVSWWDQPVTVDAKFGAHGWLPADATLQGESWRVPGARLKLGEFYTAIRGRGRLEWHEGKISADLAANGEPRAEKKSVPPLDVVVRGHGDAQSFTVESLRALLPGVSARLSEPVTFDRAGKFQAGAAQFSAQIDLGKLPWFTARGTATATAQVVSAVAQLPRIVFRAEAHDVAVRELKVASIMANGRFDWPRVQITDAVLIGGEGEKIQGRGGWDIHAQEIFDAAIEGEIRRASIARWLPAQPEFTAISVEASASGPLAELKHTGHAEVQGITFHGVKPLAVTADWRGRGIGNIETFTVEGVVAATKIYAVGGLDRSALHLTQLDFFQGGIVRLKLKEPTAVRWQPTLAVEALHLSGEGAGLDAAIAWGATGRAEIALRGISSEWITDVIALPGPAWRVGSAAFSGTWDQGPATFTAKLDGAIALGKGREAAIAMAVSGDKEGVRVEALRATEGTTAIMTVAGRVPVILSPGATEFFRIEPNGPLVIEAATEPNAVFWQQLAALSGCEFVEPIATAHVKGTWAQPLGDVRLQAARVAIDAARVNRPLPTMEQLDLAVTGDRQGVRLERFSVKVEGQAVRASGRLSIAKENWAELLKQPLAFAQKGAEAHLEVREAELSAFARFLPAFLAPQGRVAINLDYKSGAMAGTFLLHDAASRPLGPLGVLQEINADVRMAGRKVELTTVTARSGGQPVTLTGTVELPPDASPRYNLTLQGENLPFVRQVGLLVRGNLDLKLQTPPTGSPQISGTVKLRDSLFLTDVRALVDRSGGANVARRPPYFSVTVEPFNSWRLAVELSGERFLRLRTPVFGGVASAKFQLGGTLGEPRALGEVTIDEGLVLMPFAGFVVKEGTVRLTQENPYEPAVFVRGTARRFGYDLSLEINGTATKPNVSFASSPALDSEQVLLMVMTGAAPTNDFAYSGTQRVTRFGAFVGQSLLNTFGGDPGKADRLSIMSGEKVSLQGRETYGIEYKLGDRWTLVGEYDEFDDYNAGIKWRAFPAKREKETTRVDHEKK